MDADDANKKKKKKKRKKRKIKEEEEEEEIEREKYKKEKEEEKNTYLLTYWIGLSADYGSPNGAGSKGRWWPPKD